ncbi:uncharacterized protein LOC105698554 isoform X2 [Orussus abietinus]|uniref:uncharacterized protein LOC105698554 isoform X2 n=1 Tax=Orussus abietinus TaxID=222816 RepID=UPI000625C78C|nr:uncharacterized protein LOC105698554 isoform X2 [Orussus abietinus]
MRRSTGVIEDLFVEDTMMECSGDDGGDLDDFVDLVTDIADSAPTIHAAERLLTLLRVDEDEDASSEDEGVEVDVEDSEDEEDLEKPSFLHHLAASLAQELKFSKQTSSKFHQLPNPIPSSIKELKESIQGHSQDPGRDHHGSRLFGRDLDSSIQGQSQGHFENNLYNESKRMQNGSSGPGLVHESRLFGRDLDSSAQGQSQGHFESSLYTESKRMQNESSGPGLVHGSRLFGRDLDSSAQGQSQGHFESSLYTESKRMQNGSSGPGLVHGSRLFGRDLDSSAQGQSQGHFESSLYNESKRMQLVPSRTEVLEKRLRIEEFGERVPQQDYAQEEESSWGIRSTPGGQGPWGIKSDESVPSSWGAGWNACAAEALRYLVEDEGLPPHHPTVVAMKSHLDSQRERALALHTV